MSLLLGKEDSHQKEGDIHLIQKEKATRRETKTTGQEMTVQVSQVQTRTDPVDLCQDLLLTQKQNKTQFTKELYQDVFDSQAKMWN